MLDTCVTRNPATTATTGTKTLINSAENERSKTSKTICANWHTLPPFDRHLTTNTYYEYLLRILCLHYPTHLINFHPHTRIPHTYSSNSSNSPNTLPILSQYSPNTLQINRESDPTSHLPQILTLLRPTLTSSTISLTHLTPIIASLTSSLTDYTTSSTSLITPFDVPSKKIVYHPERKAHQVITINKLDITPADVSSKPSGKKKRLTFPLLKCVLFFPL